LRAKEGIDYIPILGSILFVIMMCVKAVLVTVLAHLDYKVVLGYAIVAEERLAKCLDFVNRLPFKPLDSRICLLHYFQYPLMKLYGPPKALNRILCLHFLGHWDLVHFLFHTI